ncbi:PucR family transcriptional regulator ligand-binding domain-containing protein [Peribacillus simplex]|uniref:PucR family transcriptional regulator ligand-binding domain-containing protein n=1 Tax=Peribacillus simplex TaxID=1478 RepID=UPI001625AECE
MSYLKNLIQQKASALCIELGVHFPSIPHEIIDLAERHNFPLITLTKKVKFVEITTDLHTLLINCNANFKRVRIILQKIIAIKPLGKKTPVKFHKLSLKCFPYR